MTTGEFKSLLYCEDSNLWKNMEFFNKAYRMGLFDTDGLTMTWAQNNEKVSMGKILTTFHFINFNLDPEYCGEDAVLTCLPGGFDFISYLYGRQSPAGEPGRAITSNCNYPERVMQLFDYLDDPERGARLVTGGIEGMAWEYGDDGVAGYMDNVLEAYAAGTGPDYMKEYTLSQFSCTVKSSYQKSGRILAPLGECFTPAPSGRLPGSMPAE